ncbi:MAG: cytochrome c biogenesis protein CcdA, partial [SAR202 cluster bacterium]|nr:cytochrome c biogenesis protein CcdA [SAR202 cluster bacterium]
MLDAPLGYAFFAGVAALVNPCGIAMLPAYIGYQIGQGQEAPSPVSALARG